MHERPTNQIRRKALVIAERAVDRIVISRFVALAGIAVLDADPAAAFSALAQGAPDLLVIDAGPSNDQHLQIMASLTGPVLPEIIVVTRDQEAARLLNGDPQIGAAVCKPVTSDKVVPTVHDLLDARAARLAS